MRVLISAIILLLSFSYVSAKFFNGANIWGLMGTCYVDGVCEYNPQAVYSQCYSWDECFALACNISSTPGKISMGSIVAIQFAGPPGSCHPKN